MTAVFVPERSNAQRFEALEKANAIRIGRAQEKRLLKIGQRDPASILDDPGPLWAGCKVEDFLQTIPRVGKARARTIVVKADVSLAKTLGGLTLRQRRALYQSLCAHGPRGRFS